MAERVIMPKLGAYTEDVLLAEWRVEEGAVVEAGTVVLEMETDKTTAEVEADSPGWVHRLAAAGSSLPIGAVVALIAETREEYDRLVAVSASPPATGDGSSPEPRAAAAEAPAPAAASAAPRRGRGDTPLVSPRARALLESLGLSLDDARDIRASGPGGRIVDRDVAAWVEERDAGSSAAATAAGGPFAEPAVAERIALRGIRGTIATRMVSSLQTAAQLTSILELDVKGLVDLRRELATGGSPVGVTAIVVDIVAAALRLHPRLNARVVGEEIEVLADVNIAVAVDTPDGLFAPVVHGADRLTLEEIEARIADVAGRAKAGSLTPVDMAGGTFTVSNGGTHRVDLTTAILNPPQCAILWIGRIRDRPVVVDGTVAVRPTLQACLTFDHRAIDGGPAAAFLTTLEGLVGALPTLPR